MRCLSVSSTPRCFLTPHKTKSPSILFFLQTFTKQTKRFTFCWEGVMVVWVFAGDLVKLIFMGDAPEWPDTPITDGVWLVAVITLAVWGVPAVYRKQWLWSFHRCNLTKRNKKFESRQGIPVVSFRHQMFMQYKPPTIGAAFETTILSQIELLRRRFTLAWMSSSSAL